MKISLDNNIYDVFEKYKERYDKNQIIFSGELKVNIEPYKIIEFISGGRKYIDYSVEIEGKKVKGKITYPIIKYSLGEEFEPKQIDMINGCYDYYNYEKGKRGTRKFDDLTVETIRKAYKSGQTQIALAKDYNTTKKTIYEIIHYKGAYK